MGYQQTFIPPRSRFFLSFASVKPTPHPPIHHPTPTTSHLYHPPLHPSACAFFFFTFLTFIAPLRTPLSHFLASFVTLVLSFFSSSGSFSGRVNVSARAMPFLFSLRRHSLHPPRPPFSHSVSLIFPFCVLLSRIPPSPPISDRALLV